MMSARATHLPRQLVHALAGGRARPGSPPPRERVDTLRRAVSDGSYRVSSEAVALAIMARSGRPG
jgi:hypothetical protein